MARAVCIVWTRNPKRNGGRWVFGYVCDNFKTAYRAVKEVCSTTSGGAEKYTFLHPPPDFARTVEIGNSKRRAEVYGVSAAGTEYVVTTHEAIRDNPEPEDDDGQ